MKNELRKSHNKTNKTEEATIYNRKEKNLGIRSSTLGVYTKQDDGKKGRKNNEKKKKKLKTNKL